jgi:predicted MFS family arabinose efflux permease
MGLLTAVGLVFNFGVILQTASTSQPLFIAGRFFAGLGVGLLSAMGTLITPPAKAQKPTFSHFY